MLFRSDVCSNGGQVGLLAVVVVEKLYRGGDALELDLLGGGHGVGSQLGVGWVLTHRLQLSL